MKSTQAWCSAVILFVVFGISAASTTHKCYTCDSESNALCVSQGFVAVITQYQEGCHCCRKYVDDKVVKRDCITGLDAAVSCVPTTHNFPCFSDYCNTATRPHVTATISSLMATLATLHILGFFWK